MSRFRRFDPQSKQHVNSNELVSIGKVVTAQVNDDDVIYPASSIHHPSSIIHHPSSKDGTPLTSLIPPGYVALPFPRPKFVIVSLIIVNFCILLAMLLAGVLLAPSFTDIQGMSDSLSDTSQGLALASTHTDEILTNIVTILNDTAAVQRVSDESLQDLIDAGATLALSQSNIAAMLDATGRMQAFLDKNLVLLEQTLYLTRTATAMIQQSAVSGESVVLNSFVTCEACMLKRAPSEDHCTVIAGLGGSVGL